MKNHPFISCTCFILQVRLQGSAVIGWRQDYTLCKLPLHNRVTTKNSHLHSNLQPTQSSKFALHACFLYWGRKTENPEREPTQTQGEHVNSTVRPRAPQITVPYPPKFSVLYLSSDIEKKLSQNPCLAWTNLSDKAESDLNHCSNVLLFFNVSNYFLVQALQGKLDGVLLLYATWKKWRVFICFNANIFFT